MDAGVVVCVFFFWRGGWKDRKEVGEEHLMNSSLATARLDPFGLRRP